MFSPKLKDRTWKTWVKALRPGDFLDVWADGSWQDAYVADEDSGSLELLMTQSKGVCQWLSRSMMDANIVRPSTQRDGTWRHLIGVNDIVEYHGFGRWRWGHIANVDSERLYIETTDGSIWSHRSDPCIALLGAHLPGFYRGTRRGRSSLGVAGLSNQGNTCFMNAALQCLGAISTVVSLIDEASTGLTRGTLVVAFREHLGMASSGEYISLAPTHLKAKTIPESAN